MLFINSYNAYCSKALYRSLPAFILMGLLLQTPDVTAAPASQQTDSSIRDSTEPAGSLSLDQAISLASQYQPLQTLWQDRQEVATGNLIQSRLWLNPELSVNQTGLKQKDERELDIALSQRLDLFGVRRARQQLASITLETEAIYQLSYQSQLRLAVTAAYWRVAQAEWLLSLEEGQAQLSSNSEQVAKRRLEAGRIAEVEYSRILVAHQQVLAQRDAAKAGLQEARLQLARLWGNTQPVFTTTLAVSNQPVWPVIDETKLQSALRDNPQQQLLQQQQKQARARLILAQAQAKPQPTVSLGINQTRLPSVQNGVDNRLMLGVSTPIPILNHNQGVIRATQALTRVSEAQQQYNLTKRDQLIQAGLVRFNTLSHQYQQLQHQQLPLAKSILLKTVQGFEAGKFSVTEVQQATREYQALQFNQLELLSQAWQLSLKLQGVSLGVTPELDMTDANYLDNSQFQLWQDTQTMPVIGAGE